MNDFDTGHWVMQKTENLALAALAAVPRERLHEIIAASLVRKHGHSLARNVLEKALRQVASS